MSAINISELLGPGLGSAIDQAFTQMEIAEEEIAAAQRRHPWQTDLIWDAFRQLQGTDPLSGKSENLYRAHCRELLERVAQDIDTTHATKAEILAFLVDLTLQAPPRESVQYWHGVLFTELFPDHPDRELMEQVEYNIKAAAHRTSRDELDAFYARLQRDLGKVRPISEKVPA